MFSNAIVRRPSRSLVAGITSSPELGTPDYERALLQHGAYVGALRSCGVSVVELEAMEEYPDSCFVEDVAVCTPKCAVVTNPGAPSRKGEIVGIVEALEEFYPRRKIEYIQEPGTLEGGDVLQADDHFYVGISARTNQEGAEQFFSIVGRYGFSGTAVPVERILHLKTGLSYLENGNLLISGEFAESPIFESFHRFLVPDEEVYASNCIWMNGTVIVPSGYPRTLKAVADLCYPTRVVDTSEFRKIDGGLTCLSLRF